MDWQSIQTVQTSFSYINDNPYNEVSHTIVKLSLKAPSATGTLISSFACHRQKEDRASGEPNSQSVYYMDRMENIHMDESKSTQFESTS